MTRLKLLAAAALIGLVGCAPGTKPNPIQVKGEVTFADGKPVKDVVLNLQPMDKGIQTIAKVGPDGKFNTELIPGKYNYFFTAQDGKAAAMNDIPEPYRSSHKNHTVQVSGGDVIIKLK